MRRFRCREDIDREMEGNSESMVMEVIGHATATSGEEYWQSGNLKVYPDIYRVILDS